MANMTFKTNILPQSNLSYNLGSSSLQWNFYGTLTGNAATATKATQDANGNNIASTYVKKSELLDLIYPVGAIYISTVSTSPATLFGGTWEQIKDTFLLSAGTNHTAGATGGSETVTLTTAQIPSHTHSLSDHYHYVPPQNGWTDTPSLTGNFKTRDFYYDHNLITGWGGIVSKSNETWYGTHSVCAPADLNNSCFNVISINASHSHSVGTNAVNSGGPSNNTSGATGSSGSHDNMPPYLTVYMWKRTA